MLLTRLNGPFRARELLRVSVDNSGRQRSPEEQHVENAADMVALGGTLVGPEYRDIGSASRFATKERPGFNRLLSDLREGTFGADVLVLWESSRGSRRVSEWATLLDLLEECGTLVWVHVKGRMYDPANAHDRADLLHDAVKDELSSAETSARVRRDMATVAAEGKPHGRVPFGYRRIYDENTGDFVAQEPHPVEAPIVQEAFRRVREGHSVLSIVNDFEARGIEKRSGGYFGRAHLRSMLINPLYAGLRVYNPGGRKNAGAEPKITEAVWPGLVSKAEFYAVQQILSDPRRRSHRGSRPNAVKYLLSGVAVCGKCDGLVRAREMGFSAAHTRPIYLCHRKGHVVAPIAELDKFAEDLLLAWLEKPSTYSALKQADEVSDQELAQVRDDIAQLRADLDDLKAKAAARKVTLDFVTTVEPEWQADLARLEARERELATPSVLTGLIQPGPDVRRRWEVITSIEVRHRIARLVLVPTLVGQIRLRQVGQGRRKVEIFERVAIRRQQPDGTTTDLTVDDIAA